MRFAEDKLRARVRPCIRPETSLTDLVEDKVINTMNYNDMRMINATRLFGHPRLFFSGSGRFFRQFCPALKYPRRILPVARDAVFKEPYTQEYPERAGIE